MAAMITSVALKDGHPLPYASYGNFSRLEDATQLYNMRLSVIDEREGFYAVQTNRTSPILSPPVFELQLLREKPLTPRLRLERFCSKIPKIKYSACPLTICS